MSYKSVELRPQPVIPSQSIPDTRTQYVVNRNAGKKYLTTCFIFSVVLTFSAIINESDNVVSIPYQVIMFLLCSGPFFLGGGNPRHRLLAIFMASYYIIFAMSNFFDILLGTESKFILGGKHAAQAANVGLTKSDLAVILGGVFFLSGYFFISKIRSANESRVYVHDWKSGNLLIIALLFWIIGFSISWSYNMVVTPMFIPTHVLGIPLGIASNLRLLVPISALILIYLLTCDYKLKMVWSILIVVMFLEYIVGFLANSKELSYRIPVLLVLGLYFMRGSVDKRVFIVLFISAIPYLLFFDAYRSHVLMGARNQTQMEALESFDKNADTVVKNASKEEDVTGKSLQGLKNRINGKVYIDIIVSGTDSGRVPLMKGESLSLFFTSFIPRLMWPEKPETSIGNKFNLAFKLSGSRFTYVPTTILGDLYWNFALPGVIFGMLFMGMLFGYMASVFSVGSAMTLPRFLVLLLATYYLAIRFEGGVATQYSLFVRLAIVVFIFDRIVKLLGWYARPNNRNLE